MNTFAKLIAPYMRRIANMLTRGAVVVADSNHPTQQLQIALLAGESKDGIEHLEPFGFTSCPLPGAEHLTGFLEGDRAHGVVIVVADKRYRLQGLQGGEAALYDAFGNKIHLHKDGTMEVVATLKVSITSPLVEMSGDLHVAGDVAVQGKADVTGNITSAAIVTGATVNSIGNITAYATGTSISMSNMKTVYNGHTHTDPQGGSVGTPSATM